MYAGPISRLIAELSKLPGIGQRTAQRLAFHILRADDDDALALADAIREVKEKVGHCEVCFNLATEATCRICQDERREAATICVVEQPSDVIPIERSGEFQGRYHVLGGLLSGYQLTGDKRLLALADDLGTRMLPVFDTATGLPHPKINLRTGKASGFDSNPAEAGTLLLEYGTLARLTDTMRKASPWFLLGGLLELCFVVAGAKLDPGIVCRL